MRLADEKPTDGMYREKDRTDRREGRMPAGDAGTPCRAAALLNPAEPMPLRWRWSAEEVRRMAGARVTEGVVKTTK